MPNDRARANKGTAREWRAGRQWSAVPYHERFRSSTAMRALFALVAFFAFSFSTLAQVEAIPTFTVTSNDVAQSSIMVLRTRGTNEVRVSIKFTFTDVGAKRLEKFYRAHSVGEDVRWQVGTFERLWKLDDRKHFGREGFWGLPEREAKALEEGLRGLRH